MELKTSLMCRSRLAWEKAHTNLGTKKIGAAQALKLFLLPFLTSISFNVLCMRQLYRLCHITWISEDVLTTFD